MTDADRLAEVLAELDRVRARLLELEAAAAIARGSLSLETTHRDDGGTRFMWNVPPSAPPHNEPPPIGHDNE